LEITLNSENALSIIEEQQERTDLIVGAGTVLNLADAKAAIDAGAAFVLAPTLDSEVVSYCVERDILVVPGVFTPTEVLSAHNLGAKLIKIFPAGGIGPQYIKDLLGPLNGISLLPVGGITIENTPIFMKAGAFAVGVGSFLANPALAKEHNWQEIARRAKAFISAARI
jgi:2-dehydro-3-deoxyphosphogluconate aldolase/(4S)-4-hydroxy-2-oxoglutarate aldolase